jgi:hypothetical protein
MHEVLVLAVLGHGDAVAVRNVHQVLSLSGEGDEVLPDLACSYLRAERVW